MLRQSRGQEPAGALCCGEVGKGSAVGPLVDEGSGRLGLGLGGLRFWGILLVVVVVVVGRNKNWSP